MERAIPYIETVVQLPITKENKYFVSSFHSWYLLYKALYEMDSLSLQAKEHGNYYENRLTWVLSYTRNY